MTSQQFSQTIVMIAIILTTVLFTSVFSVGMSAIDTMQQATMRQVGTSAHGGFKFLTWQQYEKLLEDPKIKDISYNIIIGFAENEALNKTYTEIRYYGLLKTIGTTNRQLRRIVRRQALLLSLIGIPAGLLLGYLCSMWIVPIMMRVSAFRDAFVVSANPLVFMGSAIFTLLTVWVSCIRPCRFVSRISPVDAVRYTEQTNSGKKKSRKSKKSKKIDICFF